MKSKKKSGMKSVIELVLTVAIAVALVGNLDPLFIIIAAFAFGILQSGAIAMQAVISVAVALFLGFKFGPVTAFGLAALLMTLSLIVIYVVTNVSCFVLYWRDYRPEFRWGMHFVLPVVATVVIEVPSLP